jgi:hypothetical protein
MHVCTRDDELVRCANAQEAFATLQGNLKDIIREESVEINRLSEKKRSCYDEERKRERRRQSKAGRRLELGQAFNQAIQFCWQILKCK